MHTHRYLSHSLALSAFGLLLACSPGCKSKDLVPTDSSTERVDDHDAVHASEATGENESGAAIAGASLAAPANPTELDFENAGANAPNADNDQPIAVPPNDPSAESAQPTIADEPNDLYAPKPTDDAPEFPSGSFGVSDDGGELEMLLGLREIPPFRIDDLLTPEDLRTSLGVRAPSIREPLTGITPSPYYSHVRFISEVPEELGVVLQYWHFKTTPAATTHFRLMERSAQGEVKPVGVASESYFTEFEGVTQLVGVDYELPAVIAISCQTKGCHVPQLMLWMRNVIQRVND